MDIAASSSRNKATEVPKLNEDKINKEHLEKDNGDDIFSKKKRHDKIVEVLLPPEYDENDSRWTLKYREPAPGLVELMEHSGVYVSADKLAECKTLANTCVALARMLLNEIFTTSALNTCSVIDATASDPDKDCTNIRPGLDVHAMIILLKFAAEYGLGQDWKITDYDLIQNGIRQKMEMMRYIKMNKENGGEPVKKKLCQKREDLPAEMGNEEIHKKFVLPPEYDENDSRWTLKYREPAPGLVELMELSGVYVNGDNLAECKRLSNDCVTFAKMLLKEIFTTSAMKTCSVTAVKVTKHNNTRQVRPRLDENAMTTLLKFVAEHSLDRDWVVTRDKCIRNSFRQKIRAMRRVVRKKEEAVYGSKKKRCQERKDLPAEYDENDSRWTLKYREPAPGLVELMEHSGVYVNADNLAECKRLAKGCRPMAVMLLTEVYNLSALNACSLSNKYHRIFFPETAFPETRLQGKCWLWEHIPRPELDAHAEIILLNFVDEYGLDKGWTMDFNILRKCLSEAMLKIKILDRHNKLEAEFSVLRSGMYYLYETI